jgi:hypothetical protein
VEAGLLPRFFDRTTRQAFGDLQLDDPPVARYVADLLTRFARTEALHAVTLVPGRRLETVVDSLLAIQHAWDMESPDFHPGKERAIRRHIGDHTLFMTGIFRDHVERHAATGYYEREGQRAYRFVSEVARAGGEAEAPLFRRLAEGFTLYAGALTYMRKVYFRADQLPAASLRDPFFRFLVSE